MVALARQTYPELGFEVGSMLALQVSDASLGGLLAYSIIHVPWERRPEVFAEVRRVLAPGGQLMLAFQIGDERVHYDEALGKSVDLDFYRQDPDNVVTLLRAADFYLWSTIVKQPEAGDKTLHGIVLATKPAASVAQSQSDAH